MDLLLGGTAFAAAACLTRLIARRNGLALLATSGDKTAAGTGMPELVALEAGLSRRASLGAMAVATQCLLRPPAAEARARISEADFLTTPEFLWRGQPHAGLKYVDLKVGSGKALVPGEKTDVVVNFDCKYKSIIAVSSRSAVTLAQNRTVEKPFSFTYGVLDPTYAKPEPTEEVYGSGISVDRDTIVPGLFIVKLDPNSPSRETELQVFDKVLEVNGKDVDALGKEAVRKILSGKEDSRVELKVSRLGRNGAPPSIFEVTVSKAEYSRPLPPRKKYDMIENAGGMFSGEDLAPPPFMLFLPEALAGMQKGGVRRFVVPPELGYGSEGKNEIPAGKEFTVEVELLDT